MTTIKDILNNKIALDTIISINGWVRTRRDSKAGLSFITVNDGSCFNSIQIIAESHLENYTNEILTITKDCAIMVTGLLITSLGSGQSVELVAHKIELIGTVENPDTYPISSKRHSVEYLRDVAHLRIRTNLFASIARVRNSICNAIHMFLQNDGFYWVHTPIITSSDAEGAGELFRVSTLNGNEITGDKQIDYKQDFFGKETFLTVSGQLNVESYCMALSKVYTFGPTFRAENSNTTRHLAEFWMVEPEIAFANLMDNATAAQQLLRFVFKYVLEHNMDEMKFFNQYVQIGLLDCIEKLVNQDFAMISYTEAIDRLLKSKQKFENQVAWGVDLSSEHEKWLCEKDLARPTIVTDYPKDIKAFYMRMNDDNKTVAAMDILVPGIGEIVGGSAREERYDYLIQRMQEMNINQQQLNWYLDLRRFGSVPHAGFGVGLDRLVSYITGVQNIRDVIPFPRSPKNANF